jgi:hypothetical protein
MRAALAIETAAAVFGMLGAAAAGHACACPAWGFGAFLVSNVGWLVVQRRHAPVAPCTCSNGCSWRAACVGLWNWWLAPLLLGLCTMANHIAAIHVLKSKLQLSDDDYRALLVQLTGKASSKAMTQPEQQHVRDHMQRLAERAWALPSPPRAAAR